MMFWLGLLAMVAVGLVLGMVGAGGAILSMPILVYLFGFEPIAASVYSLFIVGVTGAVGVWRYHHLGRVRYLLAVAFDIPLSIGTYVARQIVLPHIPEFPFQAYAIAWSKNDLVMLVFGGVMLVASISMMRGQDVPSRRPIGGLLMLGQFVALAVVVGFVAGFVGVGGGFLIIPTLVMLLRMPMEEAVPTSLFIITLNALTAFAFDLASGVEIAWPLLLASTAATAVGLLIGVQGAKHVKPDRLKVAFGWFILVMGSGILVQQLLR